MQWGFGFGGWRALLHYYELYYSRAYDLLGSPCDRYKSGAKEWRGHILPPPPSHTFDPSLPLWSIQPHQQPDPWAPTTHFLQMWVRGILTWHTGEQCHSGGDGSVKKDSGHGLGATPPLRPMQITQKVPAPESALGLWQDETVVETDNWGKGEEKITVNKLLDSEGKRKVFNFPGKAKNKWLKLITIAWQILQSLLLPRELQNWSTEKTH